MELIILRFIIINYLILLKYLQCCAKKYNSINLFSNADFYLILLFYFHLLNTYENLHLNDI